MEAEWKNSGIAVIPKIFLAENEKSKEKYVVVDDHSTIIRMIGRNGQVYVVAAFRCEVKKNKGAIPFYSCKEPIHVIGCSKLDDPKDIFASNLRTKYLL